MKKILIIDDESDILMVLSMGLEAKGYTVETADNGEEGLTKAMQFSPDAIILDVMMPELSGGEVAAQLRDSSLTKDIPIIFLTALISKEEEKSKGQCVGNNYTMAKPFDIDEIAAMIERVSLVCN